MSKKIENYILENCIGQGAYGKVYKAYKEQTLEVFAVKTIKLEKFKMVPKLHEFTLNEIKTLTKINGNPNIIRFVEMLRTSNNVYLIYEFCNGGTLEDQIKLKGHLSEQDSLIYFYQMINAFKTLVQDNILHRDLKPSNILLHNGVLKIADFGFCKTLLQPTSLTQTMVGSPIYMAPEILKGQIYNTKADIWSMGVCLYEMLFGYCPFEESTIIRLIQQIDSKPLKFPLEKNKISKVTQQLLQQMLIADPDRRIDWKTLLNHPIFVEIEKVIQKINEQKNLMQNNQNSNSSKTAQTNNVSVNANNINQNKSKQEESVSPLIINKNDKVEHYPPIKENDLPPRNITKNNNSQQNLPPMVANHSKQNSINQMNNPTNQNFPIQQQQTLISSQNQKSKSESANFTQKDEKESSIQSNKIEENSVKSISSTGLIKNKIVSQNEQQNAINLNSQTQQQIQQAKERLYKFLIQRQKIFFQIKVISQILEFYDYEQNPLLAFMILKNCENTMFNFTKNINDSIQDNFNKDLMEFQKIVQTEFKEIKDFLSAYRQEMEKINEELKDNLIKEETQQPKLSKENLAKLIYEYACQIQKKIDEESQFQLQNKKLLTFANELVQILFLDDTNKLIEPNYFDKIDELQLKGTLKQGISLVYNIINPMRY